MLTVLLALVEPLSQRYKLPPVAVRLMLVVLHVRMEVPLLLMILTILVPHLNGSEKIGDLAVCQTIHDGIPFGAIMFVLLLWSITKQVILKQWTTQV